MGFSVKFSWVLQVGPPDYLEVGKTYSFRKTGNRVFPIDVPSDVPGDLIDKERTAIAKITISSFTNERNVTTGVYLVRKLYSGQEKGVLTNYWQENE